MIKAEPNFGQPRLCLMVLCVLFLGLALPLSLSPQETNYTQDESSYHVPAVLQISEHWPRLDLNGDSLSAIAPGYHYFLASIGKVTGTGLLTLRSINLLIALTLLILLLQAFPKHQHWLAFAAILPLACSNFYVKSAAYVTTDNPALLLTAVTLLLLLLPPRACTGTATIATTTAVFTRQLCLWLVAPLAWSLFQTKSSRWSWFILAAPLALMSWLVTSWGGFVPPAWQDVSISDGIFVPAAGAYLLSVVALLAPAFYFVPVSLAAGCSRKALIAGGIIGLAFAVWGPTNPSWADGRWGGYLWNLAGLAPIVADRSIVFLILAPIGGVLLALLAYRLRTATNGQTTWLWLLSFTSWSATCLINRQVFHRYFEPPILLFLILWLLLIVRAPQRPAKVRALPLFGLAALQFLLTLGTAYVKTFGPGK